MDLKEYKNLTRLTAIYPKSKFLEYLTLGLVSEAGEVAGKLKKFIRKDNILMEHLRESMELELGDTLWYLVRLCDELNLDLESVMEKNIRKLQNRKKNKTLKGEGDHR